VEVVAFAVEAETAVYDELVVSIYCVVELWIVSGGVETGEGNLRSEERASMTLRRLLLCGLDR
jgi:hypothetical protein